MSGAFSVLALILYVPPAKATNSSTTPTVGWVSDPSGRGTFSLISTCIITLGLCVWSAMHLNIPSRDESTAQIWIRNFKWGLIGVVAPELVVYSAWRQYSSAQTLHIEVQKQLLIQQQVLSQSEDEVNGMKETSSTSGPRVAESISPWTMVHSFYAGMGGFIIEIDNSTDEILQFLPGPGIQRLTLTARGIAFLAKCGHLPNIHKDDIIDKSKADGIAKSLVCIQAGWMVAQAIGRVVLGLPVTLLEVNIIGHVLCALVIYILWWHKPRLIHEPTRLEGDWIKPISAYMYMSSQISGQRNRHAGILRRSWFNPELSTLAFFTPQTRDELTTTNTKMQSFAGPLDPAVNSNPAFFGPRPLPFSPTESFSLSSSTEQAQSPCKTQLIRWNLAAYAVRTYPAIAARFAPVVEVRLQANGCDWLEPLAEELVRKSASNWPSEDLLRGTGGHIMGIALWLASMAYGGVHIAAWDNHFPSAVEALLWRLSSVYIAFSGFLWLLINLIAHFLRPIDAYWDRVLALRVHWVSYIVLGSLCSACGLAYALARIFLVVEAFISIRVLPVEAYLTPDWTQVVPHM
ncbi:MAG: hypothetical protein M1829_005081 [Trizodia sp. TS-e1964]|nr:MAG: hypothetical protein M1829_005081 [Trizodia sp. TS-e1964]